LQPLLETFCFLNSSGQALSNERRPRISNNFTAMDTLRLAYQVRRSPCIIERQGEPMEEIAAYLGHGDINLMCKDYADFHPNFMGWAARVLGILKPNFRPQRVISMRAIPMGRTCIQGTDSSVRKENIIEWYGSNGR
jgi:hypothetical protein